MRVCLIIPKLGSIDINNPGNVQGDEMVARAWMKYYSKLGGSITVSDNIYVESDLVVHFNPHFQMHPNAKNILYLQNAYEPENYEGGTVGIFSRDGKNYDGYIFTSSTLADNCTQAVMGLEGFENIDTQCVIPFAADDEVFYPREVEQRYAHQVCFVGNNIRGREKDKLYMIPIKNHLTLYGNPDCINPELASCHRGKLPIGDEPIVYSSSSICLNVHIAEHVTHDTLNFRVYNALACGGFVISDTIGTLENDFKGAVFLTPGGSKLYDGVQHFLCNPGDTETYRKAGKDIVLSSHTFKHRMQVFQEFVRNI